jgi:hypothetical protein
MNALEECLVCCPYCGESQTVLVETGLPPDDLVEDCQVCCQPMVLRVTAADGSVSIDVRREND